MAYGPRVATELGLRFIISSVSGIGIYRTWNKEGEDGPSMPMVCEHTDFQYKSPRKWDFNTYSTEVVSIALGTNDLSIGDGRIPRTKFDSTLFVHQYMAFITSIKMHYPKTQIALLSSPLVNGENNELLRRMLLRIKALADGLYPNDKKVVYHFFEPMMAHGCSGHPNVEEQEKLANKLTPFFRELVK
mgnify:CR=1 FL=1